MKAISRFRCLAVTLCICLVANPIGVFADDIDIFVGSSAGSAANPNVLIVLDNTSNWARQSQQWPGGIQQGQAEADAIKTVINTLGSNVNVGLLEFVTGGTANDQGGFARFAVQPMTAANKAAFSTKLTTIYNNVTSPTEKRNSNTPYGDLMYDVYNYYAGANVSKDGNNDTRDVNPPNPDADASSGSDGKGGYSTAYTLFKTPLSKDNSCARNYVIFIGNPNASGPASDSAANTAALGALGGNTTQIALPYFQTVTVNNTSTPLGATPGCYANQAAAQTAYGFGWNSADNLCQSYALTTVPTATLTTDLVGSSCKTTNGTTTVLPFGTYGNTGPAATQIDGGFQSQCASYTQGCTIGSQIIGSTTSSASAMTSYVSSQPLATAADAGAKAGLACPANASSCTFTVATAAPNAPTSSANNGKEVVESMKCFAPAGTASASVPAGAYPYPGTSPLTFSSGAAATNLQSVGLDANLTSINSSCVTAGTNGTCTLACPANTQCTYSWVLDTKKNSAGGGVCPTAGSGNNKVQTYPIDLTLTPTSLKSYYVTMNYTVPATVGDPCPNSHFAIQANNLELQTRATGTTFTDTGPRNADEWSRFLHDKGIPVTGGSNQNVTTYTIDVYNKQPNATQTSLLLSMATVGGGKYFSATNEDAIANALKQIMAEIQSVNSTFASASLPVNATNRAQNENQVFIGMFRPDPDAKPRWFGNLKRYQLVLGQDGITVQLGDKNGNAAVNDQTGFITDCAVSYWTTDSSTYWQNYPINPPPVGTCPSAVAGGSGTYNDDAHKYSDLPDGPRVEKGAVAEIIRKGNNPPATDTATQPFVVRRTVYGTTSSSSTSLALLSGLGTLVDPLLSWTLGQDVKDENGNGNLTETRATIHGDVVHSRPLPINYGGGNIVVYYGANDGMFRAVNAATGQETWSFVPFEFNSRLSRLMDNSPLVNYPNVDMTITPTPAAKDYFWDGSIGVFQNADNSKVWIYPTMRRGGRSVFALDVTSATTPSIMWRAGCPNLTNDTGCTGGMSGIGQTWAMPNIAPIKGYSTTDFAVLLGGGYDSCEDANTKSPACGSPKGAAVYILDAATGALLKTLTTARSVAADVAVIDIDGDGFADYAYVLDTGGNVYRISFVARTVAADGSISYTPLSSAAWTITKVAHTNGAGEGRKFLFPPALFPTSPKIGKVYVAMGTGDREHPLASQYPYGAVTNRFYVYVDDLSTTADNDLDDAATMNNVTADPGCGAGEVTPGSSKKGWYMNLTQNGVGEQTVTSPLIVSGLITFSTNRPIPPAQGTCASPLGEARGYWVNLLNGSGAICNDSTDTCSCGGGRSSAFTGGGLPPSPVIGTVPVAGRPTTVIIGAPQRSGGASSPISPQKAKPIVKATRKRIYNYIQGGN